MAVAKNARDLPYNEQAEQAVLGSALLSRECLYTVFSMLNEDDFFLGKHQLIYRAIKNLFEKQSVVDVLTTTEELLNMKELETIGGVEYLKLCSDAMVALSSIDYYINIVNDQSVLRKLILACRDINDEYLNKEIDSINDFILESESLIKNATEKRRVSDFKNAKNVAENVRLNIETPKDTKVDGVKGLTLGYNRLNHITQGFHPGDMIVVAARPSVGKTALALNFAYRAASRSNKPVAIFSLEMPAEALITRLIGVESAVSLTKIDTGNTSGIDREKVLNAIDKISNTPLYIDDSSNIKMMDIITKSRKLQASNPDLGLIVVDYMGLISSGRSSRNNDSRQEEVRKNSLALKALARELKVPIIVVSQLSRLVEQRGENKRPMLSDLRDSGSIEADADVVMLLYREDYYKSSKNKSGEKKTKELTIQERFDLTKSQKEKMTGEPMGGDVSLVEVNVAKNRNGQTGLSYLFFYKSFGRFDEPNEEWLKEMNEISVNSAGE